MPTHTQGVVTPTDGVSERSMGKRDDASLKAAYPASPLYTEQYTDDNRRADFEERCLQGTVNDGGHTFSTFNLDYKLEEGDTQGPPNMDDVKTGGGGLPASPYVPNVTSPGPGSVNPSDMPAPPEGFGQRPSDTPFIGVGALESPAGTSAKQSRHTLGDYRLGKAAGGE